jgi:hypothetical protein
VIGMTNEPAATVAAVIDVWNGAPVDRLQAMLAPDYRGHMLHLRDGKRDADSYPGLIQGYRAANPGAVFHILDQLAEGARLVTRLEARRGDGPPGAGSIARGINISRFDVDGRLAEEWAAWSTWLDESPPGSNP